jgi:hypothetical protein
MTKAQRANLTRAIRRLQSQSRLNAGDAQRARRSGEAAAWSLLVGHLAWLEYQVETNQQLLVQEPLF